MIPPGYYRILREFLMRSDDGAHRIRLHAGDWLVTNGDLVGRFDKESLLDWLPVEWSRGTPLLLNDRFSNQIQTWSKPTTFASLERDFRDLLYTEPGDPVPDMPMPHVREGLGTYLQSRRRMLTASVRRLSYDRR